MNIFFRPKGGPSQFSGQNPHPQNRFFKDFDPMSGFYIYIETLIFTWSTILIVKIELSLRLSIQINIMIQDKIEIFVLALHILLQMLYR